MKVHSFRASIAIAFLAVVMAAVGVSSAQAVTFNPILTQLHIGSRGPQVTNLQTFLASNRDLYPAGLISGFFGRLTQLAVAQFQIAYGLPAVGRVGPLTLAKLNSVITAGFGLDIYAPIISNVQIQKTNTTATVTWTTNESASGKVFYSTAPMVVNEATDNFSAPTIQGTMVAAPSMQLSQSVSLSGLQANTTYHYIIETADASGNVSVTPMATFATNPQ